MVDGAANGDLSQQGLVLLPLGLGGNSGVDGGGEGCFGEGPDAKKTVCSTKNKHCQRLYYLIAKITRTNELL